MTTRASRGLLALAALVLAIAAPAGQAGDPVPGPDSREQELLYYWGTTFGEQLAAAGIRDPEEIGRIIQGLRDGAGADAPEFAEEYRSLLNNLLVRRRQALATTEAAAAAEYVAGMARKPGAQLTADGFVYEEVAAGTGDRPGVDATVRVHYTGSFRDGRIFDDSRSRGRPLQTALSRVIRCWSLALPLMKEGGKARITCPPELAYGAQGNARIPGGAALTFEVELLEVVD